MAKVDPIQRVTITMSISKPIDQPKAPINIDQPSLINKALCNFI